MDRLKKRADFIAAAQGPRIARPAFVVQSRLRDDTGPTRIGFTVTKKVGTATERNRVRRRLREMVRLAGVIAPPSPRDYVVVGRRGALARLARRVLSAFPNAFPPGVKDEVVGNPVRAEIVAQDPPAVRFARREGAPRLLVVGGSLGASRLNAVVPFALSQLAKEGLTLHVRHQAGERGIDAARAAYA